MTSLIPHGDDPPTRAEARLLEGRADARFQAVNARFTTTDRRFAGVVNRIEGGEQRCRSLAERHAAHNQAVEGRFDATDDRLDDIHNETVMWLQQELLDRQRPEAFKGVKATALTSAVTR